MTKPANTNRYVRITKEEYDDLIEENAGLKQCISVLESAVKLKLNSALSELEVTQFSEQVAQLKSFLNE